MKAEITVTDAMLEAASEYLCYLPENMSQREIGTEIYRAMEKARRDADKDKTKRPRRSGA